MTTDGYSQVPRTYSFAGGSLVTGMEIFLMIVVAAMGITLSITILRNGELRTERDLAQRQLIIANQNIETMRPQVDELNRLKAGALLIEQIRDQRSRNR